MAYLTSRYSSDNGIKLAGLRVFNTQEEALTDMASNAFKSYKERLLTSQSKWSLEDVVFYDRVKLYEVGPDKEPKRVKPETWQPLILAKAQQLLKEYEKTL